MCGCIKISEVSIISYVCIQKSYICVYILHIYTYYTVYIYHIYIYMNRAPSFFSKARSFAAVFQIEMNWKQPTFVGIDVSPKEEH